MAEFSFFPDFSRDTKYTDNYRYEEMVFASAAPLTEIEAEELQKIVGRTSKETLAELIGNGFFWHNLSTNIHYTQNISVRDDITCKMNFTTFINLNGVILPFFKDFSFNLSGAETNNYIFVKFKVETVTKDNVIKAWGYEQGTNLTNYILDESINKETSRRNQLSWNIINSPLSVNDMDATGYKFVTKTLSNGVNVTANADNNGILTGDDGYLYFPVLKIERSVDYNESSVSFTKTQYIVKPNTVFTKLAKNFQNILDFIEGLEQNITQMSTDLTAIKAQLIDHESRIVSLENTHYLPVDGTAVDSNKLGGVDSNKYVLGNKSTVIDCTTRIATKQDVLFLVAEKLRGEISNAIINVVAYAPKTAFPSMVSSTNSNFDNTTDAALVNFIATESVTLSYNSGIGGINDLSILNYNLIRHYADNTNEDVTIGGVHVSGTTDKQSLYITTRFPCKLMVSVIDNNRNNKWVVYTPATMATVVHNAGNAISYGFNDKNKYFKRRGSYNNSLTADNLYIGPWKVTVE